MPLDTPRKDVACQLTTWTMCRDVLAGQQAVKAKRQIYLPKVDPSQKDDDYVLDLQRATFYNGTARTREALLGLAFHRDAEVKVPDSLQAQLAPQLEDITLDGVPANDFMASVLDEVISVGRVGVWIDMQDETVVATERRPYWIAYKAEDILNWRIERIGGDYVTTRVVLHETIDEPDPKDEYEHKCIDQWRVLELAAVKGVDTRVYTVTVYRKQKDDADGKEKMVIVEGPLLPTRRGAPLSFIPFTPVNAAAATWAVTRPPLLDLVYINIAHYLTSADHEWGVHMTGVPTPWAVGVPASVRQSGRVPLGPGAFLFLDGPNANVGMLEFKGEGLGALEKSMDRKEEQMAVLGARVIEQAQAKAETAESVRARNAASHATLRTMVNTVSLAITRCLRWHLWWMGLDVKDEDVKVELNREFFEQSLSADDVKSELLRWQSGGCAFETFYYNMTRGGRNRPGVPMEEERVLIEAEDAARMQAAVDAGLQNANNPPTPGAKTKPPQKKPTKAAA